MLTVRRIYLYAVSAISLIAVAWAVIGLIRLIFDGGIGAAQITGLASTMAVIIVGLPIFLFHWLMAQRLAAASPEEEQSPIRHLFFYFIMAVAATPVLSNIYRLLDNLMLALLGGDRPDYYPYDLSVVDHLAVIVVWGVVWLYVWRYISTHRNDSPALTINLTIRRLYLLIFSLAGLGMVTWGASYLLQTLMEMATGEVWRTPVANSSAQLLMGAAIWVAHWLVLQQGFAAGSFAEERSVLRKVYLYLTVFIFSVMALSSGTLLLKRFFELALGAPPATEPLLSQLSTVVPMLLVGGALWGYHWSVVRQDAAQAPDGPRQAAVRRVYAYLVAAVGLAVTLSGIGGLLTLLVDVLTSSPSLGLAYYRDTLALVGSMTLVGTPVWWFPWRARQRRAVLPPVADLPQDIGSAERRSLVRKIYLYLFAFAAALLVFGSVGWFVFHLLTAVLGADLPSDFLTQVMDAFIIAALGVAVWLYHWWAIRQDNQLGAQEQAAQEAEIVVAVIDGDEGKLGRAVLAKLRHDLPGIQLKPLGLTAAAAAAMDGQPFAPEALTAADYLIGSWQSMTGPEAAPAVTASAATKFVVPVSAGNWRWTGVQTQSAEAHAEQIARGVRQAIDGEAVTFGHGLEPTTLAAIVLGGIIFLCVAGSVISAVVGMF
jgi:hypothetical protein